MGSIIVFLLVVLAIYVFVVFILPLLAAFGGAAALAIAAAAAAAGLVFAVKNYLAAIRSCVSFTHWEWTRDDEPARRSYFFGPGFAQLTGAVRTAFRLNAASAGKLRAAGRRIRGTNGGVLGAVRAAGGAIFTTVASACVYCAGAILCAAFAAVHGAVTSLVMAAAAAVFSVVWLADRLYLLWRKIRSDCPHCKTRFLIPAFRCPACSAVHRKLTPGPYGIWTHCCSCGEKLPATFLNGRSRLEAFCPQCGAPMAASDARPVVFQLVGGSKAGKTVYLSAFFHEYLRRLAGRSVSVTIPERYRPYFDELEAWYAGADCPATAQRNAQMYPLLIDGPLGVRRQFSIYDVAGELFDGHSADAELVQRQFHYCDGLLFLLDPFSGGLLRSARLRAGESLADFSEMPPEEAAEHFVNYLIRTGHARSGARCRIPLAVLIAKADEREVKRRIGPARIGSVFRSAPEQYGTYENARDAVCRQFLLDAGLAAAVNCLETSFATVRYFPVSAMGHAPDGTPYEPWGISEAVEWMLPLADRELAALVALPARGTI